MRGAVLVVVQLVISVLLVAAVLPMVVTAVPAARSATVGPGLVIVGTVAVFILVRLIWRRVRRN